MSKSVDTMEEESSNGTAVLGNSGIPATGLRSINSSSSIIHAPQSHGYTPVSVRGHKESVYALAMNDMGTLLVSGGTEKVLIGSVFTDLVLSPIFRIFFQSF